MTSGAEFAIPRRAWVHSIEAGGLTVAEIRVGLDENERPSGSGVGSDRFRIPLGEQQSAAVC